MKRPTQRTGSINLAIGVTRRKRWRPWMTWVAASLGMVLLVMAGMAAYYVPRARAAVDAARAAVDAGRDIPNQLSSQKFDQAHNQVLLTRQKIQDTQTSVAKMRGLRQWPYIGRQFRAIEDLMIVGDESVQAMDTLVLFLKDVFAPFAERGKVSLAKMTPDEKGQILKNIADKGEDLRAAQERIHRAAETLDRVPDRGLVPQLADGVRTLKEQFPAVLQALDQAIPASKIIPTILGYPNDKNYLFLLENNTELRPGGGFIGTYGLMKVRSGEIVSLTTDNVYNLDNRANSLPRIEPPEPLQRFLKANKWFFRDSNWSPDFPTTAQQALFFYQRQGGSKDIDGVIAVTPTAIAKLIGLVGPIKVDGIEFTDENFVDQLQYEVEQGFLRAGIPENQRKDIIGDLTSILMSRLLNLPLTEFSKLFLTIGRELDEKQLLIWVDDPTTQNILVAQNWAGAVDQRNDIDSIMVVDANLASLKTDQVMVRTQSYTVVPEDGGLKATLKITYQNTGTFDWKTTRYNTYTRVYVPAGSVLIDSSGAQAREKSNAPGKVETLDELGKTVFAAFKSIEPGTTSELVLTYKLPDTVVKQWQAGRYTLAWQKQPGMLPPDMNLSVTAPKALASIEGVDNLGRIRQDTATFTGRLDHDRTIVMTVKQ